MISGPVPRQPFVESTRWMAVDHAGKHVAERGIGFDAVELGGLDQRADHGPAVAATVAAREQVVFASERDRADRPLDRIGIEFDASVIKEPCQTRPAAERVADRIGKRAARRDEAELRFQPAFHGGKMRPGERASPREPLRRGLPARLRFDLVERGDAAQRRRRDRRAGRLLDVV